MWYWTREKHIIIARLHKLVADRAPECTFAWLYLRVEMLDRLNTRVEVTGYNKDELLLAGNEIEEPLLQRLKKLPHPVIAVEGLYLELLMHYLH